VTGRNDPDADDDGHQKQEKNRTHTVDRARLA
jgi:hypothetical protein